MSKSFNLEAFKNGKKALTRDGRVATFVGVCEKCPNNEKLIAHINWDDNITSYSLRGTYRSSKESDYDLVSMASRHQHLIDSYNPDDTWQFRKTIEKGWDTLQNTDPQWLEDYDYRLHPHNDLIKAWKKGAKIEEVIEQFVASFSFEGDHTGFKLKTYYVDNPKPTWDEGKKYRIKPSTKTVYEYIVKNDLGTWSLYNALIEEDEAEDYFKRFKGFVKTGRSWKVEV